MATLTHEMKVFLVQAHARSLKNSLIGDLFFQEFSVRLDRRNVLHYHPKRGSKGKRLAREWHELYDETRKAYLEGTLHVPIANQTYRFEVLQRSLDYAEKAQNRILANATVEQAAKEAGGMFTNRREITGRGGGPVETVGLTIDQWKEQAAARMTQAEEAVEAFGGLE
jgi:hypothetical protein